MPETVGLVCRSAGFDLDLAPGRIVQLRNGCSV
jgi:hypothetical protein